MANADESTLISIANLLQLENELVQSSPTFDSIFIMRRTSLVSPTVRHLQFMRGMMPRYCQLLARNLNRIHSVREPSRQEMYDLGWLNEIISIQSLISREVALLDLQPSVLVTRIYLANIAFAYSSPPICLLYTAEPELEDHVRRRAAFLSRAVVRPDGGVVFQPNA